MSGWSNQGARPTGAAPAHERPPQLVTGRSVVRFVATVFAPGVFAIAALLILGVPSCAGLSAIRVMHGPAGVIILALVAMPLTLIAVPLGDWLAPRSGWRRLVAFAGGGALAGLCPAVGYGMARGPDASAVATAFVLFLLGAVAGLVAGLFPPPRRDLTPRSPP